MTHGTPLVLAANLALLTASIAPGQQTPGYAEALARYEECIGRLPFLYQLEGREKLAQTRDPAALALLERDYAKSKAYPEHARYTIAHLLGQHFKGEEWLPQLAALRRPHAAPGATWLWVPPLV
ncbi:MAG: hypothetical protein ACON4Z_00650, partial [Planctomycetota bacterium]